MVGTFLINQTMVILKHMKTLKRLLLIKEMIIQLVLYWIIIVSKNCKCFVKLLYNKSANINLLKTQLSKTVQSGAFLDRLLGTVLRTGLPLMKNIIKPLAESVLIPLGLTAAASAANARIQMQEKS